MEFETKIFAHKKAFLFHIPESLHDTIKSAQVTLCDWKTNEVLMQKKKYITQSRDLIRENEFAVCTQLKGTTNSQKKKIEKASGQILLYVDGCEEPVERINLPNLTVVPKRKCQNTSKKRPRNDIHTTTQPSQVETAINHPMNGELRIDIDSWLMESALECGVKTDCSFPSNVMSEDPSSSNSNLREEEATFVVDNEAEGSINFGNLMAATQTSQQSTFEWSPERFNAPSLEMTLANELRESYPKMRIFLNQIVLQFRLRKEGGKLWACVNRTLRVYENGSDKAIFYEVAKELLDLLCEARFFVKTGNEFPVEWYACYLAEAEYYIDIKVAEAVCNALGFVDMPDPFLENLKDYNQALSKYFDLLPTRRIRISQSMPDCLTIEFEHNEEWKGTHTKYLPDKRKWLLKNKTYPSLLAAIDTLISTR